MKQLVISALAAAMCFGTAYSFTVQGHPVMRMTRRGENPPENEPKEFDLSEISYVGTNSDLNSASSNTAYLIVQWNVDGEETAKIFGYKWRGTKTTYNMINQVAKSYGQFYYLHEMTSQGEAIGGIGWDSDGNLSTSLSYDGGTPLFPNDGNMTNGVFKTTGYGYDSWNATDSSDLWRAGWTTIGYWSYFHKPSFADDFTYSQSGLSNMELENGSVHALYFSEFGNTDERLWKDLVAPVPDGNAVTFNDNGIEYRVLATDTPSVTVTYYGLDEGPVEIPETVVHDGTIYKVVSIATYALPLKANLTSLTIGKNVSGIGQEAVSGGKKLSEITVLGNIKYAWLGAMRGNTSLVSLSFPEDWTAENIGQDMFSNSTGLSDIPFPKGLNYIPAGYFQNSGIDQFEIPEGIETIGEGAFSNCYSLKTVTMPKGLSSIGNNSFIRTGVENFTIPASVSEIGKDALKTDNLKSVTVLSQTPVALTNTVFPDPMPEDAVLYVPSGASEAYRNAGEWKRFGDNIIEVLPDEVEEGLIFADATSGMRFRVTSVEPLECELTTAAGEAPANYWSNYVNGYDSKVVDAPNFKGAKGIMIPTTAAYSADGTDVTFSVTGIGTGALMNLAKTSAPATLVLFNENDGDVTHIRHIGRLALAGAGMQIFTMPSCVTELGEETFSNCKNLSQIFATSSQITDIPAKMCVSCPNLFEVDIVGEQTRNIGEAAFSGCSKLYYFKGAFKTLTLDTVGANAFNGCSQLVIDVPEIMTSAGNLAFSSVKFTPNSTLVVKNGVNYGTGVFYNTTATTADCDLIVEEGVTEIPASLCANAQIRKATLPESLKKIGESAFYRSGIESIEIPASVTELGEGIFNQAPNLVSVLFKGLVSEIPESFCLGCQKLESVNLTEGITKIGDGAFYQTSLKKVDLPASVEVIEPGAFAGAWNFKSPITEFNIPENSKLRTLDGLGYTQIATIHIPQSVTLINRNAFTHCEQLTEITGMENLDEIASGAFQYSGLTSFMVPASCKYIQDNAFNYCNSLEEFILPESGCYIGTNALANCGKLKSFYIADGTRNGWDVTEHSNIDAIFWNGMTSLDNSSVRSDIRITSRPQYTPQMNDYSYQTITQNGSPATGWISYILTGATDFIKSQYTVKFGEFTEIPVIPAFSNNHTVSTTDSDCDIMLDMDFDLNMTGINLPAGVTAPEAFRIADIEQHLKINGDDMKISYRESGTDEWNTVDATRFIAEDLSLYDESADNAGDSEENPETKSGYATYAVTISDLSPKTEYEYKVSHNGTEENVIRKFTTATPTGVTELPQNDDTVAVWFTLDGLRLSGRPQTPGMYIKRQGAHSKKVMVK